MGKYLIPHCPVWTDISHKEVRYTGKKILQMFFHLKLLMKFSVVNDVRLLMKCLFLTICNITVW